MTSDWLVLMSSLPARAGTARVALWRRLKKIGALPVNTGAHVLPCSDERHEDFTWLAQEIRKAGGTAHLVRTAEIEGIRAAELRRRFTEAADAAYDALIDRAAGDGDLASIRAEAAEAAKIDFFGSTRAARLERHLRRAVPNAGRALRRADFRGKLWITRPRPHIDRVACAWLIRRFIDPKARFGFLPARDAIAFDMPDVDFTHHGDDCTFETLVKRFGIRDAAVGAIAEIVHDADIKDGKFGRPEAAGVDAAVRGLTRIQKNDSKVLDMGFTVFDSLFAQLKRR